MEIVKAKNIDQSVFKTLEEIASRTMQIETLRTRNRDALDFTEVAVWELRDALYFAFLAGQNKK